jgi:ADP-ribosylglycohydrolase
MSENEFLSRARNSLLGLAVGDALGWPAMHHRSRLLPRETRELRRRIEVQREEAGVLRVPLPFSANRPAETFRPGSTDDTEWAAWMIERLLRTNALVTSEAVEHDWMDLAGQGHRILGGVSTQAALANLRKGIKPPASGRENPHYHDDGAMCRAVPIGLAYAGRPDGAIRAAEREAMVTNSEDGVWVAAAVAAAVSVASVGARGPEVIDVAKRALPAGSWSRWVVDQALHLPTGDGGRLDFLYHLQSINSVEYSDGCVGPETLALLLAIVAREGGKFEEALLTASGIPRAADTLPAIVGAVCGAMVTDRVIPADWLEELKILRGIALPTMEGKNYPSLIESFLALCAPRVPVRGTR